MLIVKNKKGWEELQEILLALEFSHLSLWFQTRWGMQRGCNLTRFPYQKLQLTLPSLVQSLYPLRCHCTWWLVFLCLLAILSCSLILFWRKPQPTGRWLHGQVWKGVCGGLIIFKRHFHGYNSRALVQTLAHSTWEQNLAVVLCRELWFHPWKTLKKSLSYMTWNWSKEVSNIICLSLSGKDTNYLICWNYLNLTGLSIEKKMSVITDEKCSFLFFKFIFLLLLESQFFFSMVLMNLS